MSGHNDPEKLTDLNGVGETVAENLREAGFETPESVRDAEPEELEEQVDLVGASTARALANGTVLSSHGRNPTVDQHIEDVREHLEKPISDKAAIALSPIGRKTHKEWLKKDGGPYERYQQMYREARAIAEEKTVMGGLHGEADSSMAKFLLKATHGYEDKQTVEHEGDNVAVEVDFNDVDT